MLFNNNKEPVLAEGLTAKQWVDLLKTREASDAMRSLAYYDGQQEQEVVKVLNDGNRGRAGWKQRGLTPRFRNLTKMVVEKSGLLFKDAAPVLEVFQQDATEPDDSSTALLQEELAKIEWGEFANNLDQLVRLLKTVIVMVQWDSEDGQLTLDYLHRGNCEVVINAARKPVALIHRYAERAYMLWTKETVTGLYEGDNGVVSVGETTAHPYGTLPIAVFYDTNAPRTGFWVEQDKSLVNLNEMVNLHITDSEYSILWSKMSTLFTNMRPANASDEDWERIEQPNAVLPRLRPVVDLGNVGGPGQVIQVDSMGVEAPFLDYKAPQIDLLSLDNVVNTWIQSYAADWSVKIHTTNQTAANSGFQLMVEEMANLDLRKQRQRMFENSFKRFYKAVSRVLNTVKGSVLDESAELFAKFSPPALPVDRMAEEELWSKKISEGRATEIDYFMKVEGMTKEEAEKKYAEIKAFKEANKPEPPPPPQQDAPLVAHDNSITNQQAASQAQSQ